jgi:hypothetical protein
MEDAFGTMTETMNTVKSSPTALWGLLVCIILILGLVLYWWFRPQARDVTVLGPYVLKHSASGSSTVTVFDQSQINNSLGNNFTLSFFVYMDGVNRENIPIAGPKGDFRFKPFLYILGVGDVLLDPIHQVARVRVKPLASSGILKPEGTVNLEIENFMIARWNQVTITIEGRSVDVYLNGALATSTLLENLPVLNPVGVLLETSPDFSGQAGLFQAWPSRQTENQIMRNYKRNTDTRGKPLIPDVTFSFADMWKEAKKSLCSIGFCAFRLEVGGLEYIDYEYA